MGMKKVYIIGAGAWGTALALTAKRAGSSVTVLSRHSSDLHLLHEAQIPVVHDITALAQAHLIVIAIPVQYIPEFLQSIKPFIQPAVIFVIASKGIYIGSGQFMSEVMAQLLPHHPLTILSGPNFAHEIVQNLPSATTLGYNSSPAAQEVVQAFCHPHFRIYLNEDLMGVQIGGALKNVLAIACGFVKELGLGENARVALITRALSEVKELALKKGAKAETLLGLSGIGDIMLTCMGSQSRNLQFGQEVIRLKSPHQALDSIGKTVEGYHTARAVMKVAHTLKVEMPICQMVYEVLYENTDPLTAMEALMTRPLKHEN